MARRRAHCAGIQLQYIMKLPRPSDSDSMTPPPPPPPPRFRGALFLKRRRPLPQKMAADERNALPPGFLIDPLKNETRDAPRTERDPLRFYGVVFVFPLPFSALNEGDTLLALPKQCRRVASGCWLPELEFFTMVG